MVGNDVVDLEAAERECDWRRNGFPEKVFTEKEQSYISGSGKPDSMVWLLWSMKESAYKIFVREKSIRMLAPLKFHCIINYDIEEVFSGEVISGEKKYLTFSEISNHKISTTAYSDKSSPLNSLSAVLKFSGAGVLSLRKELISTFISRISDHLSIPPHDLSIGKNELNIPYLLYKGTHLKSSISLSHHGRYGAYSAEFL